MEQPKVSIIIPIYETEKTIERCVRSLFEQTLDNIEYIFVDDCTPDSSIDILKELFIQYPERAKMSKVAKHNQNKGLPSARNTGLSMATGTYIGMVDSDDWVESSMYQSLFENAEMTNADIVWCDFFEERNGSVTYECQLCRDDISPINILKSLFGKKPSLKGCIWNKLIKKNLYYDNNILFPEGLSQGEDIATFVRLVNSANRFTYTPNALYHYAYNASSLTNNKKRRTKSVTEYLENYIAIEKFLRSVGLIDSVKTEFSQSALECKIQFLLVKQARDFRLADLLLPEANNLIFSDGIFMRNGYRFLLWAAGKHLYFPFLFKDAYSFVQDIFLHSSCQCPL